MVTLAPGITPLQKLPRRIHRGKIFLLVFPIYRALPTACPVLLFRYDTTLELHKSGFLSRVYSPTRKTYIDDERHHTGRSYFRPFANSGSPKPRVDHRATFPNNTPAKILKNYLSV